MTINKMYIIVQFTGLTFLFVCVFIVPYYILMIFYFYMGY